MAPEDNYHHCHTTAVTLSAMIALVSWADLQRNITAEKIQDRFGVSRATAYRWLSAIRNDPGFKG